MASQSTSPAWLDRPVVEEPQRLFKVENLLIVLIVILAIASRFVLLGERVMSHDEVNHVVPSYNLYQGKGYSHDPVTHGPFQFHIVALSYFLFGDSDLSARIPAALFSTAAVIFLIFAFRRYLGRSGALIAGVLFLISPYMLFYGRYTRNEAFIELIGIVTLLGILRYLEKGDRLGMFLVTISTVFHFIVKETAFIYTAQALIFLFVMFLFEARRAEIRNPENYNRFLIFLSIAMLLVFVALGLSIYKADLDNATQAETGTPAEPLATGTAFDVQHLLLYGEILVVGVGLVLAIIGLVTLARDIGWGRLKQLRSFTLLILISTLILPMLSPLPVYMLGWNPLDYSNTLSMVRTGVFIVAFFGIAVAIGMWWNPILWLQHALVFYAIFTVFYTTFFTNSDGFFTGIVGSLGYWMSQQGVERGSQPRYYYALVQMPIYEFIGLLGTVVALYFGIRYRRFWTIPGFSPAHSPYRSEEALPAAEMDAPVFSDPDPERAGDEIPVTSSAMYRSDEAAEEPTPDAVMTSEVEDQRNEAFYSAPQPLPVLAFLLYWSVTSLLAYSLAGERMPWLTVHVTMGFLLTAAWGLGYLVDTTDWKQLSRTRGVLAVLLMPVLFASLVSLLGVLLGTNPPFQGNTLEQLRATSRFVFSTLATASSLVGILYLLRGWPSRQIWRLVGVVFFVLMGLLTARAAYRASFINYDYANEYLVYAHAAPGPKQVLEQVEDISRRTVGGKNIQVAYSSDALYPYWWYFRDYPNHRWYQSNPTRDLRDFAVVIAGEDVYGKIDPIVDDDFVQFDYIRLWWPNQDYFNLSSTRVWNAISDPEMRSAVFDIWLNRDFTKYAQLTSQTGPLSFETWSPAARMRVYVRKDLVGKIWNYGASPVELAQQDSDPYQEKIIELAPAQVIGSSGSEPGQFQAPRGLKVAPDGSLYVADSRNHRIQHLSADGTVLHTWGTFGDASSGNAPGGTFNEPWDVAVGLDGSVYVSDTWNHRVQKFTADGQFVQMWGYFGQGETSEAFWGPRGLAVDQEGRLYVMDTGNKRVVIFNPDGSFVSQFGTAGFGEGQFDEPVGIALDADGNAYITDTWNQRIQVMAPNSDMMIFVPVRSWEVSAWDGQSLENKPFIAVSPVNGHVMVTDPEDPRVLEFDAEGSFVRGWGDYSTGPDGFGTASGITVTQEGDVWVSDGSNNILLRFELPE